MNPYLNEDTQFYMTSIKDLITLNNESIEWFKNNNKELNERLDNFRKQCTHKDSSGESTWEYTGQDPGSGKSEHRCTICGSN